MSSIDTVSNPFLKWSLSAEERIQGQIFNQLQIQYMQNVRADYAEMRLALEFDPAAPIMFAQQEANLKGKLDLLQSMLENSERIARELVNSR